MSLFAISRQLFKEVVIAAILNFRINFRQDTKGERQREREERERDQSSKKQGK